MQRADRLKVPLIPSEEANVHYGGHWAVSFPKPVYWYMAPPGAKSSISEQPGYGTVYTVGDSKALLEMIKRENGFAYQTHPRTKGSKGYPDKIRHTEHFLDDTFVGAGWKQMPADMSSPRMGERSLNLLDDMSNWGLKKRLLAEVDVFQIDQTHELYAHMNINYVRSSGLPSFDRYGELLRTMRMATSSYLPAKCSCLSIRLRNAAWQAQSFSGCTLYATAPVCRGCLG